MAAIEFRFAVWLADLILLAPSTGNSLLGLMPVAFIDEYGRRGAAAEAALEEGPGLPNDNRS